MKTKPEDIFMFILTALTSIWQNEREQVTSNILDMD